jgi:3-oxoacyl-[acyl-carrier protein] reductase
MHARVAVVTGGSMGIGVGIVHALREAGFDVLVADVASGADHHVDVSVPEHWEALIAATEELGGISVLVNNAGISPKINGRKLPTAELSLVEWERVLAVNLTGPYLGTKAVLPGMMARGWGRIVNISSQAGRSGARVAGAHYGSTKAGLLGLTRTVAHEYGAFGITCNAITPGRIESPMARGVSDEVNQRLLETIPVGRIGTGADIGAAVAFLCSRSASFVNGATLDVNGGSWMG